MALSGYDLTSASSEIARGLRDIAQAITSFTYEYKRRTDLQQTK